MKLIFFILISFSSCQTTIKNKMYLLDATMDSGKSDVMTSRILNAPIGLREKSMMSNSNMSLGSSCPTCGS